jgi:hypothetical protein
MQVQRVERIEPRRGREYRKAARYNAGTNQ